MTKLAVPTRNNVVDDHFGHCEKFTVFTINGNNIQEEETIPSLEGCGCKSNIVQVLKEKGVSVMLAGSMGDGAVNVLNSHGIVVVRGCSGDVYKLVEDYIQDKLSDNGESCSQHRHHGDDHQCSH